MTSLLPGNELNGRELAILTWVAIGLGYALTKPGTFAAVMTLLRAFSQRWIAGPLVGMLAWTAAAVLIANRIDLWTGDLTKDTIEWFLLSAVLLYINITKASTTPGYFRGALLDNLKLTAFFIFYVNVFVFPYPIELVLVLVATLLAGCSVVAEYRADARAAKRLCDGLLVAIALGLIIFSTQQIVAHWSTVDLRHQLRLVVLPVWLTAAVLPYLYGWSLFGSYQMALLRIHFISPTRTVRRGTRFAMVLVLNVRTRAVAAVSGPWLQQFASAETFREAMAVSRKYLSEWRATKASTLNTGGRTGSAPLTPAIPIPGIRQILEREGQAQSESKPKES